MRLFQQQTRSSFPTFFCSKGAITYNAQVMLIEKTGDFSSCPHMGLGGHKERGSKNKSNQCREVSIKLYLLPT